MASLFEMLLDTMPFAAAVRGMVWKFGKRFDECEAHEAREFITLLAPDASLDVDLPEVNADLATDEQPLWAFSHSGSDPAAVRAVFCRVHDADYVGHCVAEKIEWGLEDPVGSFQKAARVTFASGGEVLLPLSTDYVFSKWQIRGGVIAENESALWQLRSNLDSSLVVVFAYDLDPVTGEIQRLDTDRVQDPKLREELKKAQQASRELMGGVFDSRSEVPDGAPEPAPPPDTGDVKWNEAWGTIMLKGDLFPVGREPHGAPQGSTPQGVTGVVGTVSELITEPARILVVFSFATCCQRADFEPGGMVGFARCYPHLLVSASVPIKKVEASARIDRPHRLVTWHESDRDMTASCCKPGHDGWSPEIRGLIVTDANGDTSPLSQPGLTPPLPFWSNMFAYQVVDPYRALGPEKIHVVRSDRPHARSDEGIAVHREIVAGSDVEGVEKEPFQGEFDNVHIAPRLKLQHVSEVIVADSWKVRFSVSDRKKWHLDEIAMAPFCAHDCLHLHWRWARTATSKWTLGWGGGPYETPGAPMVPRGQDVWVWFRSDHQLTYHVVAPPSSSASLWTVLMHHGFGHAVAIEAWLMTALAMQSVASLSGYHFDDGMQSVLPTESTAVYYWMARYDVKVEDGEARPVERLHWDSEEALRAARDL